MPNETGQTKRYSGSRRTLENRLGETPPSYKKGGKVKKTGLAKLHKGERVIPVAKRKGR